MKPLSCFGKGTVCFLPQREKYQAIHELIRHSRAFDELDSKADFESVVISREREFCTGFGHGVAVAHGRTGDAESVSIALGISREGIDYGSPDGNPVHLLFIISNPLEGDTEYLSALSGLMQLVRNPEFRIRLLECRNTGDAEKWLRTAFAVQFQAKMAAALRCTA